MARLLLFLHTAPAHINTFSQLVTALDPTIPTRHVVDESLLQEARTTGMTPALRQRIAHTIEAATGEDTATILCTCSTIGDTAEQIGANTKQQIVRVDRAMAERAVALGDRILVAAALASTLAPTRDLLEAVADQAGKQITISEVFCEGAWDSFEQGNLSVYYQAIATQLRQAAATGDVIVLAQASMAGAATLCADLPIPILSSPQLGLEAAVQAYRGMDN